MKCFTEYFQIYLRKRQKLITTGLETHIYQVISLSTHVIRQHILTPVNNGIKIEINR